MMGWSRTRVSICLFLALTALVGCTKTLVSGAKTPVIESLETPDAIEFGTPFTVRWTGRDLPDRIWIEYSTFSGHTWLNWGEVPSSPEGGEATLLFDERRHFHCALSVSRAAWLQSPPGEVVGKQRRSLTDMIVLVSDPRTKVWKQSDAIPLQSVPWILRWWMLPMIPIWIAAFALMIVDRNIFTATFFSSVAWWFVADWYLPSQPPVTAGMIGTVAIMVFSWLVVAIERLLGGRWSYPLEVLLWGSVILGLILVPVVGFVSWLYHRIPGYGLAVCAIPFVLTAAWRPRILQAQCDELKAKWSQLDADRWKLGSTFVGWIHGYALLPALAVATINLFLVGRWAALYSLILVLSVAIVAAMRWISHVSQAWHKQLKTVAVECMAQGNLAGCLRALEARRDAGQLTEVEDLRFYAEVLSLVGRDAEAAAIMAQQEAEQERLTKDLMGVMATAGASEAADSIGVQMARGLVNLGQYEKALQRLPRQPAEERRFPNILRCGASRWRVLVNPHKLWKL
jgi:hypothetical protein